MFLSRVVLGGVLYRWVMFRPGGGFLLGSGGEMWQWSFWRDKVSLIGDVVIASLLKSHHI